MKTQILNAGVDFDANIVYAAELIKQGELVAFPTETVYGLGADAFKEDAVKKIFLAKGRPQDNPLIVHLSSIEQLEDVAKDVPSEFFALKDAFMPGPLTVILKKSEKIPFVVTAGGDTVGVRMPSHPVAKRLIALSSPIAAPSANRSKHVSPTTARHVYDDLAGHIPLILDGGECKVGIESTVLDLTSDVPTILRPGAVTSSMLAEILGEVSENGRIIKIAKSPGMKYQHYSPKCAFVVASSLQRAKEEYLKVASEGQSPVIISKAPVEGFANIAIGEGESAAHNVYAAMREAEESYDYIIAEQLSNEGVEASVMNRVLKAAGGKLI